VTGECTLDAFLRDVARGLVREAVRDELRAFFGDGDPHRNSGSATDAASLITIKAAARFVSVHPKTVWGWIHSGKLAAYGSGKLTRVRRSDLEAQFKSAAPDGSIDFAARARALREGKR
jgi:excisionase family DNA binding protein